MTSSLHHLCYVMTALYIKGGSCVLALCNCSEQLKHENFLYNILHIITVCGVKQRVSVCVCERERERERVCVCVCVCV